MSDIQLEAIAAEIIDLHNKLVDAIEESKRLEAKRLRRKRK